MPDTGLSGDPFDPACRMAAMAERPYRDDSVTERLAEHLAKLLLPALIDGVLAAIRALPAPVAAPKAPAPRKLKATGIPESLRGKSDA